MRYILIKMIALLLCTAMWLTLAPVSVFAEGEPAAVMEEAEVQAAPAPEPTAEPTPEPTQAPTPEPAQAPTPEPTAVPTEEPEQAPAAEPEKEAPAEPVEAPAPESAEAPAPAPEKKAEPENTASEPEPVRVEFRPVPDEAKLTVFTKDEKGNKEEIKPEKDGSFLLLPGRYFYTLEAEGFEAVEEKELEVKASAKPVEIVLELVPVVLPEEEEDVPAESGEETSEPATEKAAEPAEEPAEKPAPVEPAEEPGEAEEPEVPVEEVTSDETREPADEEPEPEQTEETVETETADEIEATEDGFTAQTAANATPVDDLALDKDFDVSLDYENSVAYFRFIPEQKGTYVFQSVGSNQPAYCELNSSGEYLNNAWGYYDFTLQNILEAGNDYFFAVQYDSSYAWEPGTFTVRLTKLPFTVVPIGNTYISLYLGETAELAVSVEGDTTGLSYKWYSHGNPITGANGPSLTVEAVYGQYEIVVSDGLTSQSIYFYVTVNNDLRVWAAGSEDEIDNLELEVSLYDRATLEVAFDARDKENISFEWYDSNGYIEGEFGATITTSPISVMSHYTCHVFDMYGNEAWVYFYVRVNNEFSAYVTGTKTTSVNYIANLGDSLTLGVDVSAREIEGVSISWYKDGEEIEGKHGTTYTTLPIDYSSHYSCYVSDKYDNGIWVDFSITVDNGLTAYVTGSKRNYDERTVQVNQTVELSISASAYDEEGITYTWWIADSEGFMRLIEGEIGDSIEIGPISANVQYQCEVHDRFGNSADVWFSIYVDNGVRAYVAGTKNTEKSLTVQLGSNVQLDVSLTIEQYNGLTSWWEKDGEVVEGETGTSLTIVSIGRSAQYEFIICDRFGNRKTVSFYVYVDNGFYVYAAGTRKGDVTIAVEAGQTAELAIDVYGNDLDGLTICWEKEGSTIGETARSITTEPITTYTDYYCTVYDRFGNSRSVYFEVVVDHVFNAYAAGTKRTERTITVKAGEPAVLAVDVIADDPQNLTIRWECDNGTIWNETGTVLTTSPVTYQMYYWCVVSDTYGNNKYVNFHVSVDNGFSAYSGNTTDENRLIHASYGEPVILQVITTANNGDLTYEWTRYTNHTNGMYGGWQNQTILYDYNSSTITTAPITEYVNYACTVSDQYGNSRYVDFYIVVDNKLTAKYGDNVGDNGVVQVPYGESTTLEVIASAFKGELTYCWTRLDLNENGYTYIYDEIVNANNSIDTGPVTGFREYICEITDIYGGTVSIDFSIMVDNGFTALCGNETDASGNILVPYGESTTLEVIASAREGDLQYSWQQIYYDSNGNPYRGEPIDEYSSSIETETVTEATEYRCNVRDKYGNVWPVKFFIRVVEPPIDSGTCGDDLTWTLDEDGVLTISGTGAMYDYSWSSSDYAPWYMSRESIKSVVINGGATTIGTSAFYACSGMTSVTIPEGVTSIGSCAFLDCSCLMSVTIPEGVTTVGDSAFQNCNSLTSVTIPNSVTTIGDAAFFWCRSLTSVTIPSDVTIIGDFAFYGCKSLTNVTIPEGVTTIGEHAFQDCVGLTSMTIPNSVTAINSFAFTGCSNLTSVSIPSNVTTIGKWAFYVCDSLTSVTMNGNIPQIAEDAFENVKATVYYPTGNESYPDSAQQNYGGQLTWIPDCSLPGAVHNQSYPVTENEIPATCKEEGSYDEVVYCSVCGEEISRETKPIEKPPHTHADPVIENEIPATCKEEGSYDEVIYCSVCGEEISRETKTIEKIDDHTPADPVHEKEVPATYEADGSYDEVVYCSVCGEELSRETKTIPKLEQDITISDPALTITVGKNAQLKVYDGSGTQVAPSWSAENIWAVRSDENVVTVNSRGMVFALAVGEAKVTAEYKEQTVSMTVTVVFADNADTSKYYYEPIIWAAKNGITTGTSATGFTPNAACTRGQIVTFLWRAMGEPQPLSTKNPFKDVKASDYYYLPVLWAYYEGVTTGTSDTTFAPNDPCTRKQIVTFLWRAQGSPKPAASANPFKDVKPTDYFYDAVLWAVGSGITTGTSDTTFAPNAACSRGQCVTFLWRAKGCPES